MATKKPSAAQIAARERFAAMARSGAFKKKRKTNPLSRVGVKSPSMATKKAPSKRLVQRCKATNKAPQGYYANPIIGWIVLPEKSALKYWPDNFRGFIFKDKNEAIKAAQRMANFHGYSFSVEEHER